MSVFGVKKTSPFSIVWRCFNDPTFSPFHTGLSVVTDKLMGGQIDTRPGSGMDGT